MRLQDVLVGTVVVAAFAAAILAGPTAAEAAEVLLEAEAFNSTGGWVVDQQFMDVMGSPYLLAHGMGRPVAPAATEVEFPETGTYHLWVRTKDWVPEPEWHPGRFTVVVGDTPADAVFGTAKPEWHWQPGGTVRVARRRVRVELVDVTGFEGRCDALYFTTDPDARPPAEPGEKMDAWRRRLLGLPETPPSAGEFDVVVTGGGIAGTSAAIAAARLGSEVALVQVRPVLGGNASGEIRVHTGGAPGPNIVSEINANYPSSAWSKEPHPTRRFDDRRHAVVRAEKNIHLFLNTHVFRVQTAGHRIRSVDGKEIRTGKELRFAAPVFIDCTGDGWIGYWAGADYRVGREPRDKHDESIAPEKGDEMVLGTSLMWNSRKTDHKVAFPEVPWGKKIAKDMEAIEGYWTWEYGHYLDTIEVAEQIRDYLLRAIYGAWANAKNGSNQAKYANRQLSHVPFVAGKRESRRLIGDYILTQGDIQARRRFPDGVAKGSWSIDLHYIKNKKYPFRSYCKQDKVKPYPIPYRCLYSRNVANLLMAGRCVSLTHVALGSVRVMNTGGQLGVATGAAAHLCNKHDTTPRGVYEKHLDALLDILHGRGDWEGALAPTGEAARAAAPPVPAASGVSVAALTASATRCTDGYPLTEVPDELRGATCVTVARGNWNGYAFTVDRPAIVFLAVHDRGNVVLKDGWEKTAMRLAWKAGRKNHTDTLWRKDVKKGRVRVPPHLDRSGRTFGLPHLAVVVPKDGKDVAVKPAE